MARKKLDKTLNTDLGKQIGDIDAMFNELYEAPGAPGADFSNLEVTTANASDEATAVTLANDLKAKFNSLIDRLSGN